MLLGAAVAGVLLNRQFDFYSSFSDLLGSPPGAHAFARVDAPSVAAHIDFTGAAWAEQGRVAARSGHGVMLKVRYPGTRSGITRDGLLYLPAAYFRGRGDATFGVVELFHGYPGHPHDWNNLDIAKQLDDEIAAGRIPPLIAVMPRTYDTTSTECVDATNGQQDATYLTQDVYDDVGNSLRVQRGRSWATLGVSTGGFCAFNLALHHPERYSAAASLSGYFTAGQDPGTSRLYGGHGASNRNANSPIWWVTHRSPVAPSLYLFASAGDPSAVTAATAMASALRRHARGLPTRYALLAVRRAQLGGVDDAFAPAIDWLAKFLPAPLAPPEQNPAAPQA